MAPMASARNDAQAPRDQIVVPKPVGRIIECFPSFPNVDGSDCNCVDANILLGPTTPRLDCRGDVLPRDPGFDTRTLSWNWTQRSTIVH